MRTMFPIFLCFFALALGCHAANIQPSQYSLQIFIDTDKDEFSGILVIDAKVLVEGATNFTLHSHGLNISTVTVVQQGGENIFSAMASDSEYQSTTITLTHGLVPSLDLQVTITYQGAVSSDPTGLFTFTDSGNKFYMTNFYPIYARKVFPCIDEPGAAAQIALTIFTTNDIGNVIASTPVLSKADVNGYKKYEVSTTSKIAPYSLFFTIGQWKSDSYYLPLSNSLLWLPPTLQSQVNQIDPNLAGALRNSNISFLVTSFLGNFNIFVSPTLKEETYSGLNTIVLRQDIIINNVHETTTDMDREHLVKITYAIWKMFFGTAVRPADWGNNWLATSLPLYLANEILDEDQFSSIYGNSDENLVTGLYEKVFDDCSGADSPVPYMPVAPTKPKDILSFVRSTGIEKGVYAIKTIEPFFDRGALRSNLLGLLVQLNETAVDTEMFLNSIGQSVSSTMKGINLTTVALPILTQTGYPLVTLNRNAGTLSMLKSNFVKVGNKPSKYTGQISQLADASSWVFPVTATTSKDPNPANATVYFFDSDLQVLTGYFPDNGWALLNLDGRGMIRTAYDLQSWSLFASNANATFSRATRAKLVTDAFATAESKVQLWTSTLRFLEALETETHLAPWKAALAGFKRMWSWIYYTGSSGNTNSTGQINLVEPFKAYVASKLKTIYLNLGPVGNNDDPQDPLRREVVAAMCEYGDSACISNLTSQYNNMVQNGVNPSNDMLSVVICNGLRRGNNDTWNSAFNRYIPSGRWYPQQLLDSHYGFLACPDSDNSEYSEPINSFLSIVLLNINGNDFPQDQILPAMSQILDKPQHVDQVLKFFVANQTKFTFPTQLQAEMVHELGKKLTSPTQTAVLTKFLKEQNLTSDVAAAVQAAIAAGNAKAQYIVSVQDNVKAALYGETPTTAPPTGSTGGSTDGTSGTPADVTTQTPPPSTTPGAASATTVSIIALAMAVAAALLVQ